MHAGGHEIIHEIVRGRYRVEYLRNFGLLVGEGDGSIAKVGGVGGGGGCGVRRTMRREGARGWGAYETMQMTLSHFALGQCGAGQGRLRGWVCMLRRCAYMGASEGGCCARVGALDTARLSWAALGLVGFGWFGWQGWL